MRAHTQHSHQLTLTPINSTLTPIKGTFILAVHSEAYLDKTQQPTAGQFLQLEIQQAPRENPQTR